MSAIKNLFINLYTYILNERLLKSLNFYQLSLQSQFAYRFGYNTTDAVYVCTVSWNKT